MVDLIESRELTGRQRFRVGFRGALILQLEVIHNIRLTRLEGKEWSMSYGSDSSVPTTKKCLEWRDARLEDISQTNLESNDKK